MTERRELLVIRQSAFGDIVHLMPALAAARLADPDTRLILLVKERFASFARLAPFIDEVWTGFERPVAEAVDCQGLLRTAWLARSAGIPRRVGLSWRCVREKPASLLYTERVCTESTHIVERQADLLGAALGRKLTIDPGFRLTSLVREVPAVADFLATVPAPRVLVHPASAQAGKHLSAADWLPVLRHLVGRGFGVVLSCGPGEEEALAPWREGLPTARTAPIFPLEELPALVFGCRLALAADTGIAHLADQLGLPGLSSYTLWPPERNGPYFSPRLVFWRRPPDPAEAIAWLEALPLRSW